MLKAIDVHKPGKEASRLTLEAALEFERRNFRAAAELGLKALGLRERETGILTTLNRLDASAASGGRQAQAFFMSFFSLKKVPEAERRGDDWRNIAAEFNSQWLLLVRRLEGISGAQENKSVELEWLAKELEGIDPKMAAQLYRRQEGVLRALLETRKSLVKVNSLMQSSEWLDMRGRVVIPLIIQAVHAVANAKRCEEAARAGAFPENRGRNEWLP